MTSFLNSAADDVDLFCFASKNTKNIELGIAHQKWAVATTLHQQTMAGRITKARRYFRPGAFGLLYCNPTHSFTTPFVVMSCADPDEVVTGIWPEPWRLPFEMKPLGDLGKQLPAESAKEQWPFLQRRLDRIQGRGGVSAAMNLTGTTVFVPVRVSLADWNLVCADLASHRSDLGLMRQIGRA